MPGVLVVHGAGMDMRGKVQVDIFGPMTQGTDWRFFNELKKELKG